MKKWMTALALVMAFSLAGCGSQVNDDLNRTGTDQNDQVSNSTAAGDAYYEADRAGEVEPDGTYNDQTGEATNVSSVISDTHTATETDSTALYRADLSAERARNDSLSEVCKTYASQLETERTMPKRTGYDRFCSWWFWITAILLLIKVAAWIMEKNPTTAPYIFLVRKFVPLL